MNGISVKHLLCIALLIGYTPVAGAVDTQRVLRIGQLGESTPENVARLDAEIAVLREKFTDDGIEAVEIVSVDTVEAMINAFKEKRIDWLTAPLFHALIYAEKAHAVIFTQKLKSGISKFHTVFFVRKDSEITQLEKIERKMVGFGSPLSSSDFFVPYYELHEHNYTLVKYGEKLDGEVLGKKRLYYRFSGSQRDVVKDVLSGQIDVGVLSNHQYEKILPELKKDLRVMYRTASFPIEIEVIRTDIDPSLKMKLRDVINQYNNERDDVPVLQSDGKQGKFYDFVGEGRDGFVYLRSILKHEVVPVILNDRNEPDEKTKN
ncbi:MAG: phosphate/phosphite/phosphonate ABC transporter substrate-binding protein [Gammaproteobacteria bacterium]|nr:phosphate/phosphite/phosphonate ABC transporter substrate-binding protein [Gammaproteobacteria bacterium]